MEFDDIFENKPTYHRGYGQSRYHEDNRYRHDSYPNYHRNNAHNKWLFFLLKYRTSKTIRLITKIAAIAMIAIIILVIVVLFPLIMKLAYYISQHGLQGVADSIMLFLDKLWKGFAK
jgi:hypothetical protein